MRVIIALALTLMLGAPQPVPAREVVITIDDLPVGGTVNFSVADWGRITRDLVSALERNAIPAIGFVNEWKIGRYVRRSRRHHVAASLGAHGRQAGTVFAGEPIVPDWIEKAAASPIP